MLQGRDPQQNLTTCCTRKRTLPDPVASYILNSLRSLNAFVFVLLASLPWRCSRMWSEYVHTSSVKVTTTHESKSTISVSLCCLSLTHAET